jgi:energy-coupling factor transport system permease protein
VNLFLYLDRETWIHRLDPRTKIIGTILGFMICLCFNHPLPMAGISLGIILLGLLAQSGLNFWRLRYLLLFLVLSSSLLWPFFAEGPTPFWSWGPLQVSRESLLYGMAMGLRLASFVALGLIFLSSTRNEEMTHGLIRMGLPYPVAFALSTALRLVPMFAGAGATIVQAQVSRGLDLDSGTILQRARKFLPLAIPLFLFAIRHTNQFAMALESKAFDPKAKRTFYHILTLRWQDYLVLTFLFTVLALFAYLRLASNLGAILPGRL